jgi:hypothetical protein
MDTVYISLLIRCWPTFLPSTQQQSFLEWTRIRFKQTVEEFYIILLEEHLQVALETLEVVIFSSF